MIAPGDAAEQPAVAFPKKLTGFLIARHRRVCDVFAAVTLVESVLVTERFTPALPEALSEACSARFPRITSGHASGR
jgi:hypothetical protein